MEDKENPKENPKEKFLRRLVKITQFFENETGTEINDIHFTRLDITGPEDRDLSTTIMKIQLEIK